MRVRVSFSIKAKKVGAARGSSGRREPECVVRGDVLAPDVFVVLLFAAGPSARVKGSRPACRGNLEAKKTPRPFAPTEVFSGMSITDPSPLRVILKDHFSLSRKS